MSRFCFTSLPLGRPLCQEEGHICFPALCPSPAFEQGVPLQGSVHRGSYADVAASLTELSESPRALIVLGLRGEGMEAFLAELPARLRKLPTVGGAVAREQLDGTGEIWPEAEDLLVFVLEEGSWQARSVSFHCGTGIRVRVPGSKARHLLHVEEEARLYEARDWFLSHAQALGVADQAWDRLAFLGRDGRILHASAGVEGIQLGADLPESRELELIRFDEAVGAAALQDLPGKSLIFGCAGLHGLISGERPWEQQPCAYLYGEVLSLEQGPAFANLSFSLLLPA